MTTEQARAFPPRDAVSRWGALLPLGLCFLLSACLHGAKELPDQQALSDVAGDFTASRYLVYDRSDAGYHYFKETGKFGPLGPSAHYRIARSRFPLDGPVTGSVLTYDQNAGTFRLGTGRRGQVVKADFTEKYTREEEGYLAALAALTPFDAAAPSREKSEAWLKAMQWAFHARHFEEAEHYGQDLLAMERGTVLPDQGKNRVHRAHTVLGQIALERGDLAQAGQHLLASAEQAPLTPTITTFGPEMVLARQLARAGQWEVVAQYLRRCERFNSSQPLKAWQAQVEQRRLPEGW